MIIDYLKLRAKGLLLWLFIAAIFAVVFSLYDLPAMPVAYASLISGFFAAVFVLVDFSVYRAKRVHLKRLAGEITYTLANLPEAGGVDGDYIELIRILHDELHKLENDMNSRFSDMEDYYNVWVHQIKTPIAAMGLILQSDYSEQGRELSENLQNIERYVDMVLCYTRLSSDYSDYVIKEYDLDGIVRQAVRKFSGQFIRKKLNLQYEPLCRRVITDEKWLLFVIEQVLSNSVKYTRSGGVEIYIEEPCTLCIKDSGIGISAEDMPRIFQKGYTGLNGRLDKKASGLGLYLCKRICRNLGHDIFAESNNGCGTIIKINLARKNIGIE